MMRILKNQSDLTWLCFGDLNEIMYDLEKKGGNRRSWQCMQNFKDTMGYCGLQDLGFSSYPYTWSSGRLEENNIQERIDRDLASEAL